MTIDEIFATADGEALDYSKVITELKSKRLKETTLEPYLNQLDPMKHEVFNRIKRQDKRVKIDPDDINQQDEAIQVIGSSSDTKYRIEPVARVAIAIQKLIVKRAVSFLFGNPVTLDSSPETDNQKIVEKAVKRVMFDIKQKSFNRKVARNLFSCTEVAELWYTKEEKNSTYGFDSKFKLRCAVLSPLLGDVLFPYFDETGDMIAFSREFVVKDERGKDTTYFETYTSDKMYQWVSGQNGYTLVDLFPKENTIGRIPVVYGTQPQVEWEDVQVLIERLEKLLSNFADTNDYHAAPKIFVSGKITGFAKKGESGAIIEGDVNSTAQYLSWSSAPESVRLEIDTLLRMIYTITQTPDISFDAVKGLGTISGIALKLLFMDAHLKVADHQEVFDEYLQRRINIVKAFIGKMNTQLASDAENLILEPIITPYMIVDEAAEIKIWQDANGGNPVMSQKASFMKASLTSDPEKDFDQYKKEEGEKSAFTLNEPTQ